MSKILNKVKKRLSISTESVMEEPVETLTSYLCENWDMPNDAWWQEADLKFQLLKTFFQVGWKEGEGEDDVDAEPRTDCSNLRGPANSRSARERSNSAETLKANSANSCSNGNLTAPLNAATSHTAAQKTTGTDPARDEMSTSSPSSARTSVSPKVTLLKTGTHLIRLTALNEDLSCLAFGTISSSLFCDIFWDTVAKMEKVSGITVKVFQASHPVPDLYRLSFGELKFRILYFRCNELLRSYPKVWDAPVSFIDKLDSDTGTKKALENYHESRKSASFFKSNDCRLGYYAIRAWGLSSLCLWNQALSAGALTPQLIVQSIQTSIESRLWSYFNYHSVFDCFLAEVNYQSLGLLTWCHLKPEPREDTIRNLLSKLNNKSLYERIGYDRFLVISIIWSGASDLEASKWIQRIDHKVKQLSMRQSIAWNLYARPPYLVPHRLVRPSDEQSPDSVYEAYYVIGMPNFDTEDKSTPPVPDIENWLRQTRDDDILKGKGFIGTEFKTFLEIHREKFCLCTRKWPEEPIKNPNEKFEVEEVMAELRLSGSKSSSQKASVQQLHDQDASKARKLRPASDVLNRLKYDKNFRIDEWAVGYLDRHSPKVQEKPAANWEGETTHEEFIPEHRIEYFKRSKDGVSEVYWDKKLRRDWIFNSGNERE